MSKFTYHIVAKTHQGLESILADELHNIGIGNVTIGRRAVFFQTDLAGLYRANLRCSTALRFLVEIFNFNLRNQDDLYKMAKTVYWEKYLAPEMTFAVDAVVFSRIFSHSQYAALILKDAIVDRLREIDGVRPDVDVEQPDVLVHLHINEDKVNLMLDSSGGSLHKRGYRISGMKAPLNEVLAAGLIRHTKWNGKSEFIDPMCGSGTLPIEAALFASNTPANYRRPSFGFQTWTNYKHDLWEQVFNEEMDKVKAIDFPIRGSDIHGSTIESAKNNAEAAGMGEFISFVKSDFKEIVPETLEGIFVVNPPYGERIKPDDIIEMYKTIGDHLKQHYAGFTAWIMSSNLNALKSVGLRSSSKLNIFNGALQTKFISYSLYDGSKKKMSK